MSWKLKKRELKDRKNDLKSSRFAVKYEGIMQVVDRRNPQIKTDEKSLAFLRQASNLFL